MKAELITKKEFQPVTIQLTFENNYELETFLTYNILGYESNISVIERVECWKKPQEEIKKLFNL